MDSRLLILYFLLGGAVIAGVTWAGAQGRGFMAAAISMLPSISIITLITIYLSGGTDASVSYFKGMLYIVPVWILYVAVTMLLLPRIGLVPSILAGVAVYVGGFLLLQKVIDLLQR